MDQAPETEPGSSPPLYASTSTRNLREMSISELVSVLRTAILTEDFDKVEEVLESRYAKLEAVEVERIRLEEECERGKKALQGYEEELRRKKKKKNSELESQAVEVERIRVEEELRKREEECQTTWDVLHGLEIRHLVLKNQFVLLGRKNSALEERRKKYLATMEELMADFEDNALAENHEMKGKWMDDGNALAENRIRAITSANEKINKKDVEPRLFSDVGVAGFTEKDEQPVRRKLKRSKRIELSKRKGKKICTREDGLETDKVELPAGSESVKTRMSVKPSNQTFQGCLSNKARVSVRDRSKIADGCTWKRLAQNNIDRNPCPRVYYHCNMCTGCPVKKHVQRCAEDRSVWITTFYGGQHSHILPPTALAVASTISAAVSKVLSVPMPNADHGLINPTILEIGRLLHSQTWHHFQPSLLISLN